MSRLEEGLRANRLVKAGRDSTGRPAPAAPPKDSLPRRKEVSAPVDTLAVPLRGAAPADTLPTPARSRFPQDDLEGEGRTEMTFSARRPDPVTGTGQRGEEELLRWMRCTARRYPGLERNEELF